MYNIFQRITLSVMAIVTTGLFVTMPSLTLADSLKEKMPGSGVEIQIVGNGNVLVRGAKVFSIASTTITAGTTFGSTTIAWTVKTTDATRFIRGEEGRGSLSEISIGNTISFNGNMDTGATTLTVNAKTIKNWSIVKKQTMLGGIVLDINTGQGSFSLLDEKFGTSTVVVATSTALTKNGSAILFSVLKIGDKVKALGLYNEQTKILAAEKITVNFKMEDSEYKKDLRGYFKMWGDKIKLQFNKKDKDRDGDDD
ncbi:MAG: hypothetical protein AAB706_03745 [Patescibacteria group bacterium]